MQIKIREIQCKSAIGKCGFPGGGFAINPYVGCGHGCVYCYARFIKRFTGHSEEWGRFVDARTNIADVLRKQMKSPKYKSQQIYIGTVTDPYQPIEAKYRITRKVLEVLLPDSAVSILTKSDKVLGDVDLLKHFKKVDVNFTVTSLDEKWVRFTEPGAPSIKQRLAAMKKMSGEGITVYAMMGPYWPFFTDPEEIFKEFRKAGVKKVFTESFNVTGGNFTGVESVLKKHYPEHLAGMKEILFDRKRFYEFYKEAENKVRQASRKYAIPTTIYFGLGHAAKFKQG